ncbi:uncharacterized protein LOC144913690 [Branchiostoma floridae x Branchiostoma belcheri]
MAAKQGPGAAAKFRSRSAPIHLLRARKRQSPELLPEFELTLKPGDKNARVLERMLTKTTLSTQRASHYNVMSVGTDVLNTMLRRAHAEKEEAVRQAIAEAEARAARELKEALDEALREAAESKRKALDEQKQYYEQLAQRVAEARDKLEAERIASLTKKMQREKEEALKDAWAKAEIIKNEAIAVALEEQRKKLRAEAALEREQAVAKALTIARHKHAIKLDEAVERTKRECEHNASVRAAAVAKVYQSEINKREQRISDLQDDLAAEHRRKLDVEKDFKELQVDYMRFLDLTDGQYHSDYMVKYRWHGRMAGQADSRVQTDNLNKKNASTEPGDPLHVF